ncbi:hypothetical protein U1Q18_037877, partial [Sarracenia purpurea var. burkii]
GNHKPVWGEKRSALGEGSKVEDGKSGVVESEGGIANLGFPSLPHPISGDGSGLETVRDQGDDSVGKGSISAEGTKPDSEGDGTLSEKSVSEEDDKGAVDDFGAGDRDDEGEESEAGLTKEGADRERSDVS